MHVSRLVCALSTRLSGYPYLSRSLPPALIMAGMRYVPARGFLLRRTFVWHDQASNRFVTLAAIREGRNLLARVLSLVATRYRLQGCCMHPIVLEWLMV